MEYLDTQDLPLYSAPSKQSALKPLVLLPYTKSCMEIVEIQIRPYFPLVYTTNGTY